MIKNSVVGVIDTVTDNNQYNEKTMKQLRPHTETSHT